MVVWSPQHGFPVYRQCQYICLQCKIRTAASPYLSVTPASRLQRRRFAAASEPAAQEIAPSPKSSDTTSPKPLARKHGSMVRHVVSVKRARNSKQVKQVTSRVRLWRKTLVTRRDRRRPPRVTKGAANRSASVADAEQRSFEALSGQLSLEDALHASQPFKMAKTTKPQASLDTLASAEERKARTLRRLDSEQEDKSAIEIKAADIQFNAIPIDTPPVPKLAHGLHKVLFNRGVYQFRDLHSRVYNFDPSLEIITPLTEINFNSMKGFVPSSEDSSLARIAAEHGKKYTGSTSSMTGILKHLHFLLSKFRPINMDMLSVQVREALPQTFTKITAAPEAVFLKWRNGTYAIDSDKEFNFSNVLSFMGRYLEKLLTVDREAFERYKKGQPNPITSDELKLDESHHYSTIGDILMRSQLDAHDSRLPGTGMFDLKTRAVIPIRMDSGNQEPLVGYELRDTLGVWESYEREFADMMRSTLLKYSLQARMGRMDGIFVAYHNITRLFGFHYLSVNEMDLILHGQSDRTVGDTEFLYSVHILNRVLNEATAKFPEQSLRIHFETREQTTRIPLRMDVYVEPVTDAEIRAIQSSKQADIDEWERKLLTPDAPAPTTPSSKHTTTPAPTPTPDPTRALLHLRLTAHSLQNNTRVLRPTDLSSPAAWLVRYTLTAEPDAAAAHKAYAACRARRKSLLDNFGAGKTGDYFSRMLRTHVNRGREWRRRIDALDAEEERRRGGVLVWDSETPVKRGARGGAAAAAAAPDPAAAAPGATAAAAGGAQ